MLPAEFERVRAIAQEPQESKKKKKKKVSHIYNTYSSDPPLFHPIGYKS
jgi:hypothetical protein